MALSKGERGERATYTARYRGNIGPCTGWDTSRDPSTLPDTALVQVTNARVEDGIVVSRGGQEKVSAAAQASSAAECVYGMIEVEGGVQMFLSPINISGNGMLDVYMEGKETPYVRLSNDNDDAGIPSGQFADLSTPDIAEARYCFAFFGTKIVMGVDSETIYTLMIPEGDQDPTKTKVQALVDLPTGEKPAAIYSIPGFPDTIYIGTILGKVYSYDGSSLIDISPSGGGWPAERVILTSVYGSLIAASTQAVRMRVGGAWTTVTLPAGVPPTGVTAFKPMCAFEFNGNAYIGGQEPTPLGGTILVVSPAGVATMGTVFEEDLTDGVTDFASWGGALYYIREGRYTATPNTVYVDLVKYGTSDIWHMDVETNGPIHGRLYVAGGRLFVGHWGSHPELDPEGDPAAPGPRLSEFVGSGDPDFGFVMLENRAAEDNTGAFDMIAF